MRILLTGGAGFIGSHVVETLLKENHSVTVIDNFDPFYPLSVKRSNMSNFIDSIQFIEADLSSPHIFDILNGIDKPDLILHLAAKAGVRPSIQNPNGYIDANVHATVNLLEYAQKNNIQKFILASSSSVYGINSKVPFSENDPVNHSISPYAASKIACEQLAHSYSHIYGLPIIALRFFTVYGPRQRPDLAIHKFTKMILNNEPIPVYGDGTTARDYTYISDIVSGIMGAIDLKQEGFDVFNLGESRVIQLKTLIRTIEDALNMKAEINWQPLQAGDVPVTFADISKARAFLGYEPSTDLKTGIESFVEWYKSHF